MEIRFCEKKSENYQIIAVRYYSTELAPIWKKKNFCYNVSFRNSVWFCVKHIAISKGCKTPHSTPTSPYYWYLWFAQITNQIIINANQIQIKSRDSKSNLFVFKSNHHMWFNHDLNQIMIRICPSLASSQKLEPDLRSSDHKVLAAWVGSVNRTRYDLK